MDTREVQCHGRLAICAVELHFVDSFGEQFAHSFVHGFNMR
jgi:hypothetical protein